jgi:hypothetical protein
MSYFLEVNFPAFFISKFSRHLLIQFFPPLFISKFSRHFSFHNFPPFFNSNFPATFQGYAAVMASFSYFAMGEIRSWSSSGIPSLQGKDGRNATLSQGPLPVEVVSWISKFRGPLLT